MTDENKEPQEELNNSVDEDVEVTAEDVDDDGTADVLEVEVEASPEDEGIPVTPDYDPEGEAEELDADTPVEEAVKAGLEATEEASDSPAAQAFDDALTGVMEAAEEVVEGDDTMVEHHYSDTFTVPMYGEMTLPGGIYTFIFGVLAVATVLEVLIAELIGSGSVAVKGFLLLGIAFVKALLVIAFYMHLNRDNWLYRFILGIPFAVTLVSVLYLLGLSPTGY